MEVELHKGYKNLSVSNICEQILGDTNILELSGETKTEYIISVTRLILDEYFIPILEQRIKDTNILANTIIGVVQKIKNKENQTLYIYNSSNDIGLITPSYLRVLEDLNPKVLHATLKIIINPDSENKKIKTMYYNKDFSF